MDAKKHDQLLTHHYFSSAILNNIIIYLHSEKKLSEYFIFVHCLKETFFLFIELTEVN